MEKKEQPKKKEAKKRRGKGSVFELKRKANGVWVGTGQFRWRRILGWLPDGKPIYDEGLLKSRKDAEAALSLANRRLEQGGYVDFIDNARKEFHDKALSAQQAENHVGEEQPVERQTPTLQSYAQTWLLEKENQDGLKPKTLAGYADMLKRHILPTLGGHPLTEINAETISRLREVITGKKLSPRTANQIFAILSSLLSSAVASKLIQINPAFEKLPRGPRDLKKALEEAAGNLEAFDWTKAWTEEETQTFLSGTREDWYGPAFGLMALTGMRRGEACGLRWPRVDLKRGTLRVVEATVTIHGSPLRETPKNKSSIRTIHLLPEAVDLLRTLKERQARERARRQRSGEPWGNVDDHVITRPDGVPPNPDSMRKLFHKLCDKAGVRTIAIHGLRHTYVTMMANLGMPIDVVAKMAGHKNSDITRDVYQHVFEDEIQRAVQAMPSLFKNVGDKK